MTYTEFVSNKFYLIPKQMDFHFSKIFKDNGNSIVKPLIDLTKKCKPDKVVVWTDECRNALADVQTILNRKFELILPNLNETFFVQTDASSVGVGGVLLQKKEDLLHPCLFASRKLLPQETRYSVIERECLALVWTLQKFSR